MQKLTIANESFEIPDLEEGTHPPEGRYCAIEMVAYLAGERHTDHPECVCPVLGVFVRQCNDYMGFETRNRLLTPLLLDLIGTRSTKEIERQRAFMLADWAVRTVVPIALRDCGHDNTALLLHKLPAIVDKESATSAADAAYAASAVADAADTATNAARTARAATAAAAAARTTMFTADSAASVVYACFYAASSAARTASHVVSSTSEDAWDLVPEIIQKLISVGDRDSMDLTKVAERARKIKERSRN